MNDIYFAMEEFFLVVAIVQQKTIYFPGFYICYKTQDTYDEDEAMMLAL